ncbi:Protein pianissimo A [Bienertia sinuspersici]
MVTQHKDQRCINSKNKKENGINWSQFKEDLKDTDTTTTRQRAKSKWDDWGDKSTGFFFKSVKTRALKNEIRTISIIRASHIFVSTIEWRMHA